MSSSPQSCCPHGSRDWELWPRPSAQHKCCSTCSCPCNSTERQGLTSRHLQPCSVHCLTIPQPALPADTCTSVPNLTGQQQASPDAKLRKYLKGHLFVLTFTVKKNNHFWKYVQLKHRSFTGRAHQSHKLSIAALRQGWESCQRDR